jgi:hypothetical protein
LTPRKGETPEAFRARQRARYAAADPEYQEQRLARQRERRRQRYATDPVYREQLLKRQRERYETDPEYRQQVVERERKRYARKGQRESLRAHNRRCYLRGSGAISAPLRAPSVFQSHGTS